MARSHGHRLWFPELRQPQAQGDDLLRWRITRKSKYVIRITHAQIRSITQGLANVESRGNSVHPYCLARAWITSSISALLCRLLAINTTPSLFSYAKKTARNPEPAPGCQKYRFEPFPR